MGNVVITGSTRGIGFAMADAFLARGCAVAISGRTDEAVDDSVQKLAQKHGAERVFGQPCDVTELAQVQALWDAAQKRFGRVDIWVNNAGISHPMMMLWEVPPEQIRSVLETNLVGTMLGARVALKGMLEQNSGKIFNMEGYGSGKHLQPELNVYGTSKAAITFYSRALALELKDKPVIVGTVRPGMMITDLVMDQFKEQPERLEEVRGIFNIIADRAENVAPVVVEKMLACEKSGEVISYMTGGKMMLRFLTARFTKRDVFSG